MTVDPQRLKELFLHAAEIESRSERAAFLERECGHDAELHRRVEMLLHAHDDSGGFLAPGPTCNPTPTGDESAPDAGGESVGDVIGPYKLLQKLGEGGMGTVWIAEQHQPVKRRVALKVIKPGMDSAQVLGRFERERQALALMDHTSIAKVFDAGETARGHPYFVMELVHGVAITKYCNELNLPIRERLALFVPVCQAIQHAHQKGIIHRDIKPSNVLVCLQDGKPVPKIIDFGVAKAVSQRLTEESVFTEFGAVVGTLEYMAPEQAEMSPLGVDTRADVYALGALLYELLTGTTPLDKKRLQGVALVEMLRIIKEEEPPRPSTRLSESKESLPSIAAQRHTEPARLTKEVRGELDWIVMKCLEKDRTRRYETANGLARDVERYLADEPVEACPPSRTYRLTKFARKYRAALSAAAAFVLLLTLAAAVSAWLAVRAMQAEAEAIINEKKAQDAAIAERQAKEKAQKDRERAERAEALAEGRLEEVTQEKLLAYLQMKIATPVNQFLQELLGQADIANQPLLTGAARERNPNVTVKELLDRAAREIPEKFADSPLTEAAIRLTIGNAYRALGRYAEAQQHLQQSLEMRARQLGADNSDTLAAKNDLAMLYQDQGQYAKAEPLFKEILQVQTAKCGPDHADTLTAKHNLAGLYLDQKQYAKAEPLFKEVLAVRAARRDADHPDILSVKNNLALLYSNQGQYAKAEPLYKEVLKGETAKLGADHPYTLTTKNNLAGLYLDQRQCAKAEPLFKEVLDIRTAKLGADHPDTLNTKNNLALLYWHQGQYAKAEPLFRDAVDGARRKLGLAHPNMQTIMGNLLDCYERLHQPAKAEPLIRELAAFWKDKAGANSIPFAGQLAVLGRNLLLQHKAADAEPILRECLAIRQKKQPDAWSTFNTQSMLGESLLGQKKYADAEPLLRQGYEGMKARQDKIPSQAKLQRLSEALERLAQLYEATGNKNEAAKWRKELEEVKKPRTKAEVKPYPRMG